VISVEVLVVVVDWNTVIGQQEKTNKIIKVALHDF